MRRSIGNMGEGRIRALPRQSRSLRPTAPRSDHPGHEDDERTMSGIAAPVQIDTLRRVLRLRALNSGPLMMERRVERHEPVMVTEILDALSSDPAWSWWMERSAWVAIPNDLSRRSPRKGS